MKDDVLFSYSNRFFRSLYIGRITFIGSGIAAFFLWTDFFDATSFGFFYRQNRPLHSGQLSLIGVFQSA